MKKGALTMKTLHQIDVSNKTVITRVDFNVPFDTQGHIVDDTRILAHLETIHYLTQHKARVVLLAHLGNTQASLKPIADILSKHLGQTVHFCSTCVGDVAEKAVTATPLGGVILMENLRMHAGEKENDMDFATQLARLGDVYVNDAFATAHREHASVCAITNLFETRAAGILMGKELSTLTKLRNDTAKPFSVIVGGSKISTKLGMLKEISSIADQLFIGGAMANTFLMAQGHVMGKSLVETDMLAEAKDILENARKHNCKVYLPKDVMASTDMTGMAHHMIYGIEHVPADHMALDVGPSTTQEWFRALDGSGTILWNGPIGAFEVEAFRHGTTTLAHELAGMKESFRVAGGGDTIAALKEAGVMERFDLVSTGGGAMLRFLEGDALPAVEALRDSMHAA